MRVEAEEAMDALRNELASVKGANARLEEERVKLMEVSKRLRAGRFNYNRNLYFMLSCD
jgi:predicted nuclease with TOPRIM domain|tara:strand:+ start:169 stop:345 length:177 start_codon:yes stop_codon:yes gene_type:complete